MWNLHANEKRALIACVCMVISIPFILWGAKLSFESMHNSPVSWLPDGSEPREALLEFSAEFDTEDMLVVSWEGCTIDDPRLPKFAEIISSKSDEQLANTNLSGVVLDGFHAIERLIYDVDLSRQEAIDRLRGLLVGRDGETSCALLPTMLRNHHYRAHTFEFVLAAAGEAGVPSDDVHMAGALVEGVSIDRASNESFRSFVIPSAILVSIVCWICLRSWRLSSTVLMVAGYSGAAVIGALPLFHIKLNAVLVVMAPLLMVLTVSAGVHLVNYYLDELRKGTDDPVRAAIRAGWWPCTFCTLTTAIGMGSLTLSEIVPVKQFGALTAGGVIFSLCMLLLLLPGAMQWHFRSASVGGRSPGDHSPRWVRTTEMTRRAWAPIVVLGLALMVTGVYGIMQVQTSVNVMKLLPNEHWLVQDYQWMENRLGPLVPIEVLLRFEEDCPLDDLQRAEVVRNVENKMHGIESLGSVFSGTTFLPDIPGEGGFQGTFQRAVFRRQMPEIKEQLEDSSWLAVNDDRQVWRVSARVPAFGNEGYDELMAVVRREVNHAIAHEMVEGLEVSYTGIAPVVSHSQNLLLNDLFRSLVAAVGLVALVLTIVFRSVRAGLVAMIPNVFPTVVLFGGMGLAGFPVDIGTVMTARVALGIAVDDTIHFLTWFRREQLACGSRPEAVRRAFAHSASAMMQTTTVCGLGLAPFVFAVFVPTAQFAWMMIALLGLAIIGDLILLPALLFSPLGKAFESTPHDPNADATEQNEVAPPHRVETSSYVA